MKAYQLKAMAKQRIANKSGTLIGAALVYFAILFAGVLVFAFVYSRQLISEGVFSSPEALEAYMNSLDSMTQTSALSMFVTDFIFIIVSAVVKTLSVGFFYLCLCAARLRNFKVSDLFYVYKRNPDKVILIALIQSLLGYLCTIVPTLIATFCDVSHNIALYGIYTILYIAGFIAQTVITILLSQSYFIYIDNTDESVITCIKVSALIMKNNIFKYFLIGLSFVGWMLLAAFSFGIVLIFVMPYMYVTYALFYMQLKGELGSSIDVTVS